MPCRSQPPPPHKPPVTATYLVVMAAFVAIAMPTLLNVWLGHTAAVHLPP